MDDSDAPVALPPPDSAQARQMGGWEKLAVAQATAVAEPFHLWPEHLPALRLFTAVQTQWRFRPFGMGGSLQSGLDYPGVRASPAFLAIPAGDREAVFADVCVIEAAWLAENTRISLQHMKR